MSFDYLGSKKSLNAQILEQMLKVIEKNSLEGMSFIDAMSGSGAVTRMALQQGCTKVLSNDLMEICRLAALCLTSTGTDVAKVAELITEINDKLQQCELPTDCDEIGDKFWICRHLSGQHDDKGKPLYPKRKNVMDKERLYFTKLNGYKIDTARQYIDELFAKDRITSTEKDHLVYSVVLAASKVGNGSSQWGAYLPKFKPSSLKPLNLLLPKYQVSSADHSVKNMDVIDLLKEVKTEEYDIIYCDPPYNARRYDKNYHILNYVAQYSGVDFKEDSKTAMPVSSHDDNRRFCSASAVRKSLDELLGHCKCKYFFMSYNNESLLDKKSVLLLIGKYYRQTGAAEIPYKRFVAQEKTENKGITEYLFYGIQRKEEPNTSNPGDPKPV